MEDPEEEILVDPQNSIIMDGHGYRVMSGGGVPFIDKDGRELIAFTIKPDEIVKKRYNWVYPADINASGNKKIIIAQIDLVPMNIYDDSNRMWLYVKSFNHEETNVSKREKFFKMEIERERKEKLQIEAENIRLNEINELLRTNPGKYLSMSSEYFQEMMKGVSALNLGNKEKQQ